MNAPNWWTLIEEVFRYGSKAVKTPCCWPEETDVTYLLHIILRSLPFQEEQVIRHYFGIGEEKKSLVKIARILNISHSQASEIKKRALRDLNWGRHLQTLLAPWAGVAVVTQQIIEQRDKMLHPIAPAYRAKSLEELAKKSQKEILGTSLMDIEFSTRTHNALVEGAYIRTFGELVQKSEKFLLQHRNFGQGSLAEVKKVLSSLGLSLGMEVE